MISLHSKKIIHRDLKPENILFKNEETKQIGLIDFGFATFEDKYDELFTRCGTPGFVAPEVLNDKKYDTKIDIYSCGIILYLMLTGDIPFNSQSYNEIVQRNMNGEVDFSIFSKNKTTNWLLSLLRLMLEKNPLTRISAKEAIKIIDQCTESKPDP